MALFPNEEYMIRKETQHKGKKGIMGLTNFRLIWIGEGSSTPEVMLSYTTIKDIDKVDIEANKVSYLSIKRKNIKLRPLPELVFVFNSTTHAEDLQTCNDYIKTYMNHSKQHDDLYFFSPDTQTKINILESNYELAEIHKLLVRTGKMGEDEFWSRSDEYQKYLLDKVNLLQVPGKLTSVIRIPHRFVTNNQVVVDFLNKHKLLIFRQLPQIKHLYLHTVPHKKSEKEFWRNFWENQLSMGSAMSDALEIKPDWSVPEPVLDIINPVPKNHGIFQPEFKLNSNFLQIAHQVNIHSFYVISDTKPPPQPQSITFNDYSYKQADDTSMQIDAPVPTDENWSSYIIGAFKSPLKNVFPSSVEAIETMRQIFQQTYFNKIKNNEDQTNSCNFAKKIYQVLKYFYAEFPLSIDRVERLDVIILVAEQAFAEMKAKSSHKDSIQSIEIMIKIAYDRLQQIKQGL